MSPLLSLVVAGVVGLTVGVAAPGVAVVVAVPPVADGDGPVPT
jgi:hypothetical protein